MATISDQITVTKNLVDPVLKEWIDQQAPSPLLRKAMIYAVEGGGKRLRPFLVLSTSDLFNVPQSQALQVAAALELVHCYSLIHDDLPAMDNSDLRRGQPSCWKAFDEATAILVGDALLTLAFEVLSDPATHPLADVRLDLVKQIAIASGGQGMVAGQMLDIHPLSTNLADVVSMQDLKTGCLIAFACEAGAILGQTPQQDRNKLRQFGKNLGLIYQITDDFLDMNGSSLETGKPTGQDQSKTTILSLKGSDETQKFLDDLVSQSSILLDHFRKNNGEGEKVQPLADLLTWVISRKG